MKFSIDSRSIESGLVDAASGGYLPRVLLMSVQTDPGAAAAIRLRFETTDGELILTNVEFIAPSSSGGIDPDSVILRAADIEGALSFARQWGRLFTEPEHLPPVVAPPKRRPGRRSEKSEREVAEIVRLKDDEGWSLNDLAAHFHRSKTTVHRWYREATAGLTEEANAPQ